MILMLADGLLVAVGAPVLLHSVLRRWRAADRWALPAPAALPLFLAVHCVLTVAAHRFDGAVAEVGWTWLLLGAALVFWAPVLGSRRRLSGPGRFLYLFAALPFLDLPAAWLLAVGDRGGAVAMLAGMSPVAGFAVLSTWRWISAEESVRTAAPAPPVSDLMQHQVAR